VLTWEDLVYHLINLFPKFYSQQKTVHNTQITPSKKKKKAMIPFLLPAGKELSWASKAVH